MIYKSGKGINFLLCDLLTRQVHTERIKIYTVKKLTDFVN